MKRQSVSRQKPVPNFSSRARPFHFNWVMGRTVFLSSWPGDAGVQRDSAGKRRKTRRAEMEKDLCEDPTRGSAAWRFPVTSWGLIQTGSVANAPRDCEELRGDILGRSKVVTGLYV